MVYLVDAHSHIQMETFDRDRDEVLRRAISSGVISVVVSGYDAVSNYRALGLNGKIGKVLITLGLSPNMRHGEDIEFVKSQIIENQDKIVAVGEIGLDSVKSRLSMEKQAKIFREFLTLAQEINKPVVVHARGAEKEALKILRKYDVDVMFHCFTGSIKILKAAIDCNYTVSISTMVCFLDRVRRIAEETDVYSMVIESDSPFLSPVRGRNEPSNIVYSLKEIAEIKGMEKEELAIIIRRNTERFFNVSL